MRHLLLLLILPLAVQAQTPGQCEPGTAEGELDANQVRARAFNQGNLFFGNETDDGSGYLVPQHTGRSTIFAAGLWVGGKVDGQIRVAGTRYANFEFWPGPLHDGATLPNPSDCSTYDRIFVVSRDDVEDYLRTGEVTDDLRDWPVAWGAPVLNGDGVEGNYNVAGGDQPAIFGDQMAWWVMNDLGNEHQETQSNPLGVEVQVSAFAANRGALAVEQATYYHLKIINRNSLPIDSAYVSLFVDADLGDATDDWVGSDTTRSMGFVYNGDGFDEPSHGGYGIPPAQGYKVVQGPVGLTNGRDDDRDGVVDEPDERLRMTAFNHLRSFDAPVTPPPCSFGGPDGYWMNWMRGLHCVGAPITEGGDGYQTEGPVTTFAYPGDPVTSQYWSEANIDGDGNYHSPGDRRLLVSTGPFRLEPGELTEVVFALPFAQGASQLESVTKLRVAAEIVQNAWDIGFLAPSLVQAEPSAPETFSLEVSPPFPNPFAEQVTIRYELSEAMATRIVVYDALGRIVAILVDGEVEAGSHEVVFDGEDLAPGAFVVRFEAAGEEQSFSIIKMR